MVMVMILSLLYVTSALSEETKQPSGTVKTDETQFGLIIGGSFGGGVLHFKGKNYHFKTSGLKVGGLGVAKVAATGEVFNLYNVSQFPGTYVKGSVGFALGGGVGGFGGGDFRGGDLGSSGLGGQFGGGGIGRGDFGGGGLGSISHSGRDFGAGRDWSSGDHSNRFSQSGNLGSNRAEVHITHRLTRVIKL